MPLTLICGDIVHMETDAIVNAANPALQMGGGVCGAIFAAAGADELQAECDEIGFCEIGRAVITKGYHLPARHVIHTVGPIWSGGDTGETDLLASCYRSSLRLARANGLQSIAFPVVSSGTYGYPFDEALHVAVRAIGEYLRESDPDDDMDVVIVVLEDRLPELAKTQRWPTLSDALAHTRGEPRRASGRGRRAEPDESALPQDAEVEPYDGFASNAYKSQETDGALARTQTPFTRALLRMIDERGMSDAEICVRANIDRRLFSKLRSDGDYHPGKRTALAFAVALCLTVEQTSELLESAGYALSRGRKLDVIVVHFIASGNCDIYEINEALFAFSEPLLGA